MTHNSRSARIFDRPASPRGASWRIGGSWLALPVVAAGIAACSGDSPVSLAHDGAEAWSVQASAGAVTLAVGATQQLTATVRTMSGAVLTDGAAVTFTSTDTDKVTVSAAGLITGRALTPTPVPIVTSLIVRGVTLADTTIVAVTAEAHPLKKFSIHPAPPDSMHFGLGEYKLLTLVATDSSDTMLYDLAVKYTSLNPLVTAVQYGQLYGYARGTAAIIASTVSYGIARADTVLFTVTNPITARVYYSAGVPGQPVLSPSTAVIGVGGQVIWTNGSTDAMTITFANSGTSPIGGTVLSALRYGQTSLVFPAAGSYSYTDSFGNSGLVVVLP